MVLWFSLFIYFGCLEIIYLLKRQQGQKVSLDGLLPTCLQQLGLRSQQEAGHTVQGCFLPGPALLCGGATSNGGALASLTLPCAAVGAMVSLLLFLLVTFEVLNHRQTSNCLEGWVEACSHSKVPREKSESTRLASSTWSEGLRNPVVSELWLCLGHALPALWHGS